MQITYSHISSRTLTRSHKKWSTFSTIRETRLNYPKQYAGITWQRPSNSWRIQSFMLVNPMDRVLLLPPRARMEADFCEFENAQHKEYAFTTPDISISKRPLCWTRLICMKYGTTSRKNRHTCRSGISLVQHKRRTLQNWSCARPNKNADTEHASTNGGGKVESRMEKAKDNLRRRKQNAPPRTKRTELRWKDLSSGVLRRLLELAIW